MINIQVKILSKAHKQKRLNHKPDLTQDLLYNAIKKES